MEQYISANDPRFFAETDAETIQNAVNYAAKSACKTLRIPRLCQRTGAEAWHIHRAILLPSGITLLLDGCHLTLEKGIYDNIFRSETLFTAESTAPENRRSGIRILGKDGAILDGGEGNDLREWNSEKDGRPNIRFNSHIFLANVDHYELSGFSCVNLRWWAINQIGCKHGYLHDLHFFNGTLIPNQDGINLRVGCSDIRIENISGRTGDDLVALTALPIGKDGELLTKNTPPDIHDIEIRHIRGSTMQTLVAMRNNDGAKIYNVHIEDVEDTGEYTPWGVLRIGENNYYQHRLSCLGETYNIHAEHIRSKSRGTVFLGGTLKDSVIRDVYAGGSSMFAVSTFIPAREAGDTGIMMLGGVTMENVLLDGIAYNGTAGHCDDELMNYPGTPFPGCALDFRLMRETDSLTGVEFKHVTARDGAPLCIGEGVLPLIK